MGGTGSYTLTLQRQDVSLDESQRTGLLDVISSEADRLARIVNDILWASRLESGTMRTTIKKCDGVEIARSVVETARHYIPPGIDLAIKAPKKAPMVAADPDKAHQVLTNLVDNAVKYSPDGGKVLVEITLDGALLRYAVHDEGLGVPPSEHRRIFEKFYRLDPDLTRGVARRLQSEDRPIEHAEQRVVVARDGKMIELREHCPLRAILWPY